MSNKLEALLFLFGRLLCNADSRLSGFRVRFLHVADMVKFSVVEVPPLGCVCTTYLDNNSYELSSKSWFMKFSARLSTGYK